VWALIRSTQTTLSVSLVVMLRVGARLAGMTGFKVRCPRCKQTFSADDADDLADSLLDHVGKEHGHVPPREHVLARIEPSETAH
jgi:uncharacterized C2H2 Zn-finger protein